MAVTATTSGRPPKPPKPKKPPKPPNPPGVPQPSRGGRSSGSHLGESQNPVGNALATVGAMVGETVATGQSSTAAAHSGGGRGGRGEGGTKDVVLQREQRRELRAAKEARRERVAERRENRQERRADRRENRQGGGGATTYTGTKTGSKPRATSGTRKPKADIIRTANQDRVGGGGGFKDISNYQTPASFDTQPDTRFLPLPGAGSEGGGGGGASVTGQSLSGLAGSDVESLIKGAKKSKRERRRRRTE